MLKRKMPFPILISVDLSVVVNTSEVDSTKI